jgi:RHS repeat-associated protein
MSKSERNTTRGTTLFAILFLLFAMDSNAQSPSITSLSATSGPVGMSLTVSGSNFGASQGSSTVTFNGTSAVATVWNTGSIQATVPTGATSGNVVVTLAGVASNGVSFTVTPLPSGWTDDDIGTVGVAGNATYANGVFTVSGAGAGINGTSDAFNFAYQPLSGSGTIVARVVSVQGSGSPIAGVMIRDALTTSSTFSSAAYQNSNHYVCICYRSTTGGSSSTSYSASTVSIPYWVELAWNGTSFSSYMSLDGVNWQQVGSTETISMAESVYVGLAVTSGTTSSVATATFDSVSISSSAAPAPAITSVSATTGSVGSQVTIAGNGFGATQNGSTVTVNDVPLTINSWSGTSLLATIPSGTTTGPLVVSVAPSMNDSNPVEFTVTTQPLPAGWLDQDVGTLGAIGSATYANGAFTVQGAGDGTNFGPDEFHFAYQPLSGNGTIIARVLSTSTAQAGIEIRQTLDDPESPNVQMTDTNQCMFFYDRTSEGGGTGGTYDDYDGHCPGAPFWVMLVRSGNSFSGYMSPDGVNWEQVGATQTISMPQTVYVGLVVSKENYSTLGTATFDSVSVSPASSPGPAITSLSATTGPVGSQVAIFGSGFGATQGASLATINDTPLTIITWSNTGILGTIPTGANSGPILVSAAPSMNDSNAVEFAVTSQPLPAGWLDQDVGEVGTAGSATYTNSTFTIKGSGSGLDFNPDEFHFVYQPLSGNGTIIARIASTTASSVQAGVEIRQTLDDPASPDAQMVVSNSCMYFYYRTSEAGNASGTYDPYNGHCPGAPFWVMLVRSGNSFSGYMSPDGVNWQQVGSTETITMSQNVYVGLVVSSQNPASLGTATFDSVSLSTAALPAPSITAVSATTGSVGSQVTITGSGFGVSQNGSQVTLNDLPLTIDSWNSTSIIVTIPAGATSGPLLVSVAPSMTNSNAVEFSVTTQPLLTPWQDLDVGLVGVQGSATYSNRTFTINAAGIGTTNDPDGFHYVYQPLSGDGTIVVQVASTSTSQTQAGIEIRQTLDDPASPSVQMTDISACMWFYYRTSEGGGTSGTYGTYNGHCPGVPFWLELVRSGNLFNGYMSPDGVNWTQVGTTQTIALNQNLYVGMVASSRNTSSAANATFSNVTLTVGTTPFVTGVSPSLGPIGTSVTIEGSSFGSTQGTSTVTFNGATASITSWSNNQIVATVPTNAPSGTGPVTVTVNSISGPSDVPFTVINPQISTLSPPAAQPGATVVLSGIGFGASQASSTVLFNGVSAGVSAWSDTSITASVPLNVTTGPVTVVEDGVTSNSVQFSVLEPLSITGISTNLGAPGDTITITGTGFGPTQSDSTIDFFGTIAAIQSWTDTQIVATVPSGSSSGPVDATVGSVVWYGPSFTVKTTVQVTDSQNHQSSYTSALIGGKWRAYLGQGSGCSTCTQRGNISYTYDVYGNPASRTDENGNVTTYTYDGNGNVLTMTAPISATSSATTTYTYNSFGEVLTATDPLGFVTTNAYDANGNLLSVTTPAPGTGAAASVTQYAYNSLGELTTITDPLGHTTSITYTSVGLIQTITDVQSNVTTYAYDSRGNRTSVTDANNKQTTFTYDSMSRLTQITYPDSTTTQFAYDYRGRRISVTDQNGKTTAYAYDDADRLTSVTDAANNVTTYGYDTESNLTSIQDANQNATNFSYDAFGRVIQTTFPSGYVETYAYDNVGNLTSKTDRKNQLITYTYDQLNRLTQKSYPDTSTVNYTYDLDSRLTQVTDPTGTYQFTFDNMGRLTGTSTQYAFLTSRSFTTSYSYDAASNRTGFTDPEGGSSTYAYDTLNRLQTLTPPAAISGGSFGFAYDALSRRTSLTRPNSVNTSYTYDNLSHLLSVTHANGGTTLDGASYTLDSAGNRTAKSDLYAGVTTNYGYDAIYELLNASQAGSTTESYTYDPVGNRLGNLTGSGWIYNTSNELNSRPSVSYTYDYNGNTQTMVNSSGTTTYNWDYENRVTSVVLPGSGGTASFKYDPFGRRIYKSLSSATSIYAYDGINLVEETNASGSVVARYSQGASFDEPLAMLRSATTSFYEEDGLGSVTSLSSGTGVLAQTYTFDSFGNQTASSGSLTNPFRYTARELDSETGLYFYRARYFDPQTGRFLSEDPVGFSVGNNFYVYVLNNPVNLIDPVGLAPWPYDLYEKARKKLKKADCAISAAFCRLGDDVNALNSMSNDAITNTAEAQQSQGKSGGDLGMQRIQLCLAADQNCKNALEKCIKLALTNPFPPPSWLTDLMNYFSKNPSTPAPPIKRE